MIFEPPLYWENGRPPTEFAHFLAQTGEYAEIITTHVRARSGSTCRACGRVFPCRLRRAADQAFHLAASANRCECGLNLDPPTSGDWWQPALHHDPGPMVKAVARAGEDPELRRAVRTATDSGWIEIGVMVNFYQDITPPMPWQRVAMCWAGQSHPVTPVAL